MNPFQRTRDDCQILLNHSREAIFETQDHDDCAYENGVRDTLRWLLEKEPPPINTDHQWRTHEND